MRYLGKDKTVRLIFFNFNLSDFLGYNFSFWQPNPDKFFCYFASVMLVHSEGLHTEL